MTTCDILCGDALTELRKLPAESVQCCVTSPPYWGLRDYGVAGQLGLESTQEQYVAKLIEIFREVRRVLRADGVLWLNLGDSYNSGAEVGRHDARINPDGPGATAKFMGTARQYGNRQTGLKPKDLVGIPWRVAFALQADGWWLRQDIIWSKPNPMPESVTDRCTKAHEYIFLLSKAASYYYDAGAVAEAAIWNEDPRAGNGRLTYDGKRQGDDGTGQEAFVSIKDTRNRRSVWEITTKPYAEAHFATFPPELPRLCILAGSKPGDTILDPFAGSGTTGEVAQELGRHATLIELNPAYCELIKRRTAQVGMVLP